MNYSGWRSHLTALITAIVACLGLLSLSTAPAWAVAGTITEFPVFTLLWGDLHPYALALPLWPLLLAAAATVLRGEAGPCTTLLA